MLKADAHWYPVAAITDDTHLLLTEAYGYVGGTGAFSVQKSLTGQPWFSGGNYLRGLNTLHCPANFLLNKVPDTVVPPLLGDNPADPQKPGYNNYDLYYRRDWFHNPPYDLLYYDGDLDNDPDGRKVRDKRNLVESAFPPADTLVTFCPYHRRSGNLTAARNGDQDIVLFADGSVMILPSYPFDALSYNPVTSLNLNPAQWFSLKRAERGE